MDKWEMKVYNAVSVLVVIVGIIGLSWVLYGLYEEHFGKEKPVATGHTEEAWAQNRRADIVYPEGTGAQTK